MTYEMVTEKTLVLFYAILRNRRCLVKGLCTSRQYSFTGLAKLKELISPYPEYLIRNKALR